MSEVCYKMKQLSCVHHPGTIIYFHDMTAFHKNTSIYLGKKVQGVRSLVQAPPYE